MVTMATLPPAKELKIQVVTWQNEIRTLDVLKSPTCLETFFWMIYSEIYMDQHTRFLVLIASTSSENSDETVLVYVLLPASLLLNDDNTLYMTSDEIGPCQSH